MLWRRSQSLWNVAIQYYWLPSEPIQSWFTTGHHESLISHCHCYYYDYDYDYCCYFNYHYHRAFRSMTFIMCWSSLVLYFLTRLSDLWEIGAVLASDPHHLISRLQSEGVEQKWKDEKENPWMSLTVLGIRALKYPASSVSLAEG